MQQPVIQLQNVWFAFNGRPVLRDVSFDVQAGEFLALIGPNGGGKTTLLKLMLGLLEPKRGEVLVFGKPPRQSSRSFGYVPQELAGSRGFPVSVMDAVLMGRMQPGRLRSRYKRRDREAVEGTLRRLHIWEYRNRRVGELSGGQRQRVFIARALVTEPDILFLDEPVANIDAQGQAELYTLLEELNRTVTIVMVTHEFMVVSSFVKSVACVNRSVHFHGASEITAEMIEDTYSCPVELVAHGVPHRVLRRHEDF
jgi:zinc transport system ATP-binding protein